MGVWPKLNVTRFGEDDVVPPVYSTVMPDSGVPNTKGAYVSVVASVPFDVSGLLVSFQIDASSPYLVDLAVGPTGSEVDVFPNLALYAAGLTSHTVQMRFIPLRVRAGAQVSARFQSATSPVSAANIKVQLVADSFDGIESPQRWEDWGTDLANSTGTVVTGGAADTKGSFAQLIAATARTSRWLMLGLLTGTIDDMAIDFAVGTTVKLPNVHTTNEFNGLWALLPMYVRAASQVQARLAAAGGASTATVIAYGGG